MWRPCVFREVFRKHSRSIRHVRKTVGKHASSSWCIRNENLEVLGSVWFPNTPNGHRTWRMLSESVLKACGKSSDHSRSIRRVLKAFGKHTESVRKGNLSKSTCGKYSVYSESILKPYWKHSESKRKAFGDTLEKTHSEGHSASLKKHTTFVYGKQTEAHSGQCDRPT